MGQSEPGGWGGGRQPSEVAQGVVGCSRKSNIVDERW